VKNEVATEGQTAIHAQVSAAREGRDPRVIARLFSGWAVFGERQFVRGYLLLLPDPVAPNLNALGARERIAFLSDMSRLGDALLKVTGAGARADPARRDQAHALRARRERRRLSAHFGEGCAGAADVAGFAGAAAGGFTLSSSTSKTSSDPGGITGGERRSYASCGGTNS